MDSQPNLLETLRRAKLPSRIIEDYKPVTESLEWRISEQYWRTAGIRGFIDESVPFSSTSGGALSQDAANLLFVNCQENPPTGVMVVLELCAGSGLFARLFLETFQRLCMQSGQRFDQQLVYYVTDGSPATVAHWKEIQLFDGTRAVPARGDARRPLVWETADGPVQLINIRAVFCNYGFDSLPAAILRRGPEEFCIRTHLTSDEERLRRAHAPALEEIRALAENLDPNLFSLTNLFEVEAAFLPCDRNYTFRDEALEAFGDSPRVVLNHGAMDCITQLLPALDPAGFIAFSDFGIVDSNAPVSYSNALKFGSSTAIGLHFPVLARFATSIGAELITAQEREGNNLHYRLLVKNPIPQTSDQFVKCYGAADWSGAQPHIQAGAIAEAKRVYESALEKYPNDWSLLGEVAEFLVRQVFDYEAGLQMAKAALAVNPWYSTWLWNVYGDSLYGLQRHSDAVAAYKIAEEMSPRDVRTQVNLSYGYFVVGDHEAALTAIAKGFAHDSRGEYRDRLREKQQQILASLRALQTDGEQASNKRRQRLNAC